MTSEEFDPSLVPELLVSNVSRSIDFWCDYVDSKSPTKGPKRAFLHHTYCHISLSKKA